jgi:membrane fusion protein (multidrug efflux system)
MLNRNITILIACLAILVLAGCGDEKSEANIAVPEKALEIIVSKVEPVILEDTLVLPAHTEPDKDVCISSESTGTVIWLGVKEGDWVKKGAIIARLDSASSGARFDKAKAVKNLASEQLRRRRELLEKGVLAQEEFDQMEAELASSEASLKEMLVNVEYGVVRAPIAGIINKRYVDRGERLTAGAKVVDIVDPSIIRATIYVPEMDIPYISKGQEVTVSVDAIPGKSQKGIVDFVSFKANEASKTFEVRVLVDNEDGFIRAGMLARVSLLRRALTDAITTPLFAIINQGGERILYVEEDGVARARTIKIGIIENDRAQVLEGLNIGDNLIVAGHTMVEDGMLVVVQ